MPPTVTSVDERVNDIAADVSDLKALAAVHSAKLDIFGSQLAFVVNGLATSNAQMATMIARFDSLSTDLKRTDTRLEDTNRGLERSTNDFRAFQGRAEAFFGMAKWVGAFAATTVVGFLASGIWVARSAGRLDSQVEHHQQTLDEIRAKLPR